MTVDEEVRDRVVRPTESALLADREFWDMIVNTAVATENMSTEQVIRTADSLLDARRSRFSGLGLYDEERGESE